MTIAVDIKTGAVVGQVTGQWNAHTGTVQVLTKDGYQTLSAHDVRLEKVS
jgi:hypothetical protein